MTGTLDGKVVIVTGGGSGIGKGTSLRLADDGAAVGVTDMRGESAERVAAEIRDSGGRAIGIECDVADEQAVAASTAAVVDEFGGLNGLVCNAGTVGSGWIHETTLADWRRVMAVNIDGAFLGCKHAIPHFLEAGGGSIVMTASIAASVIGAGGSAASYPVSKAGMLALARQIAVDYGDQHIRANSIQPSGVEGSNLGRHVAEEIADQDTPFAKLPRPKPWLPIRRQGRPYEDYGAAISFLLSDDAAFITGVALPVDGGYLLT